MYESLGIAALVDNQLVDVKVIYGMTSTVNHRDAIVKSMYGKMTNIILTHDVTAIREVIMWDTHLS